MSAKPILYYASGSPPSRSIILLAKYMGLELELKSISLLQLDQMNPEFLKLNPQHTIPTLVDDGRPIYDSHAIATYLVGKYGKPNDPLYPHDLYVRARIDQRLQFETASVFLVLSRLLRSYVFKNLWDIPEETIESANIGYSFLETFLGESKFLIGDHRTVADFSVITSLTQLEKYAPIDVNKYPLLTQWIKSFDEFDYFNQLNTICVDEVYAVFEGLREKNKHQSSL